MTNRPHILSLMHLHREEIRTRFAVNRLAIFGSAARDELRPGSDIDILVEFSGPATFDGYMDLKFFLEDLLGNPVDLVTVKGIREELHPVVELEAVQVI
ncbi:MAG: nucleotidyltransferase family protein [Acidobacteria bacterium]|nr:nucleotidyltransferase family protein [Acidobacteriota bacterium]